MVRPNVRVEEATRLACLHRLRILDAAEEPFDRLTRLAAEATGLPVASNALVEATRVWRRSMVGMDPIESRREGSVRDAVIPGGDAVAAADLRLVATEAVVGGGARSCAGASSRLAGGAAVGVVCVFDRLPPRRGAMRIKLESRDRLGFAA